MADQLLSYFVRHGSTSMNAAKAFRGPLNPSLDGEGYKDAVRLKEYFKNEDFGDSFASDKLRAQETANIILEPHDTSPIIDPNLNAWNVGYLGGKPKAGHEDEIAYYTNHPDEPVPGGESLNSFKSRLRPSIRHIVKRGAETGLPSIAVAHSSIIHELGAMFHNDHTQVLVKPGGVVGVYHRPGMGLYAKQLIRPLSKDSGFGS